MNTNLSVTGGNLNGATNWQWYSSSCGGTLVGSSSFVIVAPTATTTYYVRGEGGGCLNGSCGQVTITVETPLTAPTDQWFSINLLSK